MNEYLEKELNKSYENYKRRYDVAQANYRDTGLNRYYTAMRSAEEMILFFENSRAKQLQSQKVAIYEQFVREINYKLTNLKELPLYKYDEAVHDFISYLTSIMEDLGLRR